MKKITSASIAKRKRGQKIVMTTAYDYSMAKLFDQSEIDILLVGDSLGMVVQGQSTTIHVTLDEAIYHTKCVSRAVHYSHLVGDMPFMTYQLSPTQALENAGRLLKEGYAESVKLEGGERIWEHVFKLVQSGIPVMGHIGLTPQSFNALGGFVVQGKTKNTRDKIIADAKALDEAGAYAIVLEAIPFDLAKEITEIVSVPTIGIGAGSYCDGQVLVSTDFLGISDIRFKFVKQYADVGNIVKNATKKYIEDVRDGLFPAEEHFYKVKEII